MRTVGMGADKPKKTPADTKLKKENEQLKSELAAVKDENEQLKAELEELKAMETAEKAKEEVKVSKK